MTRAWVAALLLCGCTRVLDIEDLPRADASAEDAAIVYLSKDCPACLATSCDAPYAQCIGQPACRGMAVCLAGCARDDVLCRSECENADPDTSAGNAYRAFDDCRRRSCVRECVGLAGAATLLGEGCKCIDTICAKELSDCVQSGAAETGHVGGCERYAQCLRRLEYNPAGTMQCRALEPTGMAESAPIGACIHTAACPECPWVGGGAYACVGKYAWERPAAAVATFTASVAEFVTNVTVPAATVTACPPERCSACDSRTPGAIHGMGDGDGFVTLPLMSNFRGCFRITGGADHTDTLSYLGRPVLRAETWSLSLYVRGTLAALAATAGVKTMAGRGHIAIFVYDCNFNPSSGVRVEISPSSPDVTIGYIVGAALRLDVNATAAAGAAAVVNVPPGLVTIKTFRGDRPVGNQAVWVRPDPSEDGPSVVTTITMLPSETPL